MEGVVETKEVEDADEEAAGKPGISSLYSLQRYPGLHIAN